MSIIDEYLSKVDNPQKKELQRIRSIVKKTIPDALEVMSYGMPGFKYRKKYLIGFCEFKDHLSLFPTAGPIEAFQHKLKNYRVSKGTIQFSTDNPIPETVIRELLLFRAKTIFDT